MQWFYQQAQLSQAVCPRRGPLEADANAQGAPRGRGVVEEPESRREPQRIDGRWATLGFWIQAFSGWQKMQVCGTSDRESQSRKVNQTAGSS